MKEFTAGELANALRIVREIGLNAEDVRAYIASRRGKLETLRKPGWTEDDQRCGPPAPEVKMPAWSGVDVHFCPHYTIDPIVVVSMNSAADAPARGDFILLPDAPEDPQGRFTEDTVWEVFRRFWHIPAEGPPQLHLWLDDEPEDIRYEAPDPHP